MILYINGDSHTAAAEAVNPYAFAEDDPELFYMGRAPHPANLAVSWGRLLSDATKASFHCGAESASSNQRIMRTTRQWIDKQTKYNDVLVIVQWSTWEREEWLYDGTYYQVGSSGIDDVPQQLQEKYRNFVISTDWKVKTQQAHDEIWLFHQELDQKQIPHIFFNGNNSFEIISDKKEWGPSFIGPYDPAFTYDAIIRKHGIQSVAPNSWHFGKDGHSYFYRFMLQYIIANKFI